MAYLRWSTPNLWHGLYAYAREANWLLMGTTVATEIPKLPRRFDGVITLIAEDVLFDVHKFFPNAKIVDIQGVKGLKSDAQVTIDHIKVGRMAADYLHQIDCRSFVILDRRPYRLGPRERSLACKQRLLELEVPKAAIRTWFYDGWHEYSGESPASLRTRLKRALQALPRPIGLFASEGYAANVVSQGILDLGYRVPDDVAILCTDNDRSICEMARVPLSSIDVNLPKLGYEAARLLDRLMSKDTRVPRKTLISPLAIEKRRSTERAGSTDPLVAAIRTYILDHYMEKITAEHIAQDMHVSRAKAFARFRKAMNYSIGEEIERVRLDRACSLLETTDYKISAVARLSGYHSAASFCRMFKQRTGSTPTEMRQSSGKQAHM